MAAALLARNSPQAVFPTSETALHHHGAVPTPQSATHGTVVAVYRLARTLVARNQHCCQEEATVLREPTPSFSEASRSTSHRSSRHQRTPGSNTDLPAE